MLPFIQLVVKAPEGSSHRLEYSAKIGPYKPTIFNTFKEERPVLFQGSIITDYFMLTAGLGLTATAGAIAVNTMLLRYAHDNTRTLNSLIGFVSIPAFLVFALLLWILLTVTVDADSTHRIVFFAEEDIFQYIIGYWAATVALISLYLYLFVFELLRAKRSSQLLLVLLVLMAVIINVANALRISNRVSQNTDAMVSQFIGASAPPQTQAIVADISQCLSGGATYQSVSALSWVDYSYRDILECKNLVASERFNKSLNEAAVKRELDRAPALVEKYRHAGALIHNCSIDRQALYGTHEQKTACANIGLVDYAYAPAGSNSKD